MIFIHSLGQPLIVRSHSKVHRCTAREEIPSKFPREPHVFPIIVTSLDSTDNKHGFQRQVRRCRRRRNFIYYIEYFRKAAGVLLLGAWCKNIQYDIPIITLVGVWPDSLSPLEKLGPTLGWPYFSRGDKPSGHTPTRVIIVYYRSNKHFNLISMDSAINRSFVA